MATPGERGKRCREGSGALSYRRPYLSEDDLAILNELRRPGESPLGTLRRTLRETAARRPIDEALRAVEARLARLEAGGVSLAAVGAPAADGGARGRVMSALRLYTAEEDDG